MTKILKSYQGFEIFKILGKVSRFHGYISSNSDFLFYNYVSSISGEIVEFKDLKIFRSPYEISTEFSIPPVATVCSHIVYMGLRN